MKVVLIGASNNPEKFGNKILKDLISKGHYVFPINPKESYIEGIKCYNNLKTFLSKNIEYDILNFVVRPEIVMYILESNLDSIKDKIVWCQPGTSDDNIKKFLKENSFKNFIVDSCIMVETQK